MKVRFFLVDAFTLSGRSFTGNPAAVCVLPSTSPLQLKKFDCPSTKTLLQKVAAEMKQSETVFVQEQQQHLPSENRFVIRWFSPTVEVPLCGHATLAASHCLFSEVFLGRDVTSIDFMASKDRVLRVERGDGGGGDTGYSLRFPNNKPHAVNWRDANDYGFKVVTALRQSLICHDDADGPGGCAVLRVKNVFYHTGTKKYIVELATPEQVVALRVDTAKLHAALSKDVVASVTVTAQNTDAKMFREAGDVTAVSRHFAPWVGIPEDPVTGAAHTVMVPMYAERLGRSRIDKFVQAYPGRGGVMRARVESGKIVVLSGEAKTIVRGDLLLDDLQNKQSKL